MSVANASTAAHPMPPTSRKWCSMNDARGALVLSQTCDVRCDQARWLCVHTHTLATATARQPPVYASRLRGLSGHPWSNKCFSHPSASGSTSLWHSGQRFATSGDTAGAQVLAFV